MIQVLVVRDLLSAQADKTMSLVFMGVPLLEEAIEFVAASGLENEDIGSPPPPPGPPLLVGVSPPAPLPWIETPEPP